MCIMFTKTLSLFMRPHTADHPISTSLKSSLLNLLLMGNLIIVLGAGLLNVIKAPPHTSTLIIYIALISVTISVYFLAWSTNRIQQVCLIFLIASWLLVTTINILYQQAAISGYLSLTLSTALLLHIPAGRIAALVNFITIFCLSLFGNTLSPEMTPDRDIFFLVINLVNVAMVYGIVHILLREAHQQIAHSQQTQEIAQYQLDKLAKEYHTVINTISEAVIITDMHLKIITWNTASERIYGYRQDDVRDKKLTDVIPTIFSSDDNQTTMRQRHIETGSWQNEVIQKRSDERLVHALSSMSLLYDPDQKPIGAITINQEITNYVDAEKELHRLNKKIASLQSILQDIVLLVAEDGREQVNALRSQAQMLQYKSTDQTLADPLKQTATSLDQLTNIILTINQFYHQLQEGEVAKLDIEPLVEEAFKFYHPIAEHKHLKFSLAIDDHALPLIVKADKKLLMRSIKSYINNALQFTSPGGTVQVSLSVRNQQVTFTVSDTGNGLPLQLHNAVFQPYFNYRYRYTSDILGVGLSLYMVQSIIIHYNGTLIFESKYAKGSLFGFTLPHITQALL